MSAIRLGWIICFFVAGSVVADEWKMAVGILADRTARSVGDLVTVLIEESSSTKKDASDSRSKSTAGSTSFELPGMKANGNAMWNALTLPEWSVDASKAFDSSGSKQSTDELSASVTVQVMEVLPNGNLMITGERVVNINNDLIKFVLKGTVRQDDIDRSNQVLSSRIAGASITYETVGEFASSQKKGPLTRFVDWIIPF